MKDNAHHIRIEFNTAAGTNIVQYYALDEATLRKAQIWQAQHRTPPTAEQFMYWLGNNGGQLDRADGPAIIATFTDGTRTEAWWSKGKFIKDETTAPLANPGTIPGVTLEPPPPP